MHLPGSRRLRWLGPALLCLASVVATLALGELALRWLYPRKALKPMEMSSIGFEFSPDYLVRLKPGFETLYAKGGADGQQEIDVTTNADGFRGPALRSADARVIVYGDSNVQARFSRLEDTFPAQLQRELVRASGRDVEVLNAGIVGAGPDQELLRFELDAAAHHPQLAIFVVFADNDFGDLVRNRLFDLDAAGALVPSPHERSIDPLLLDEPHRDGLSSLLLVRALRRLGEPYSNAFLARDEYAVYASHGPKRFSHFADHYDSDLALEPRSAPAAAKRALLAGVLARARSSADALGVRTLVLVLPSGRDLTTHQTPNHRDFAAFPDYAPTNLSRFAAEAATAAGIDTLNLYEPFVEAGAGEMYREHDDHWSDAGQAVAAGAAAATILADGLLDQAPASPVRMPELRR